MPTVDSLRRSYARVYNHADRPEALPWYENMPPVMLHRVIADRRERGRRCRRALDIGCGAGLYSLYLAEQGYQVTGVDFMEPAIEFARARAAEQGARDVEFVHGDLFLWEPEDGVTYDLIVDFGCLHNFTGELRERFRSRVARWLDPDGDYVLVHFAPRHRLDWRPIGPRRRTRAQVLELMSPDLSEQAYHFEERRAVLPVGPRVRLGSYWFRHRGR